MSWLVRLWPEERIAALFFAGVALVFAALGHPITLWLLVLSYLQFLLAITVFVLPPWLVVLAVRKLRGRAVSGRAILGDLVTYLRALLALLIVLVAYTNLKCRLLLIHPRLYDRIFGHLDDLLHMGGGDF
ncbi:MAG: hypothetical protein ABIV06_02630, partial [Thermoanaerobaculia bacterium]